MKSTRILSAKGMLMMGGLVSALCVSATQAATWGGYTNVGPDYENWNMYHNGGSGTVYGKPTYAQTFSNNSWHAILAGCNTGNVGWIQKEPNKWAQAPCKKQSNGSSGKLSWGQGALYR